jgi:HlyD family secretion protein
MIIHRRLTATALLSLALVACTPEKPASLPGYIEADYTRVASPIAGRLIALQVVKGQEVAAGVPLFALDTDEEKAAVDQAAAQLKHQNATVADLTKGKRREEIAVLEAQERQAAAQLSLSQADLHRQQALADKGFISAAGLDGLRTRVDADTGKLAETRANLQVARLAARSDTRTAAEADVAAARAALAQNQWKLDQKSIRAPLAAHVDDTLYRVGEWVPAGSPVISLLAPGALKLRFFAAQAMLSRFAPGTAITARCDGCGAPFTARVSYVAKSPEYTPPVIYSQENRARLVFLVEAVPDKPATLVPGQPVDILLAGSGQ